MPHLLYVVHAIESPIQLTNLVTGQCFSGIFWVDKVSESLESSVPWCAFPNFFFVLKIGFPLNASFNAVAFLVPSSLGGSKKSCDLLVFETFLLSFIDPVLVFRILVLPAPLHIDGKRRFLGVVHWHRQEPRPAARVSNSRPQTEVRKTHKTVPGRIFGQSQLPFILVLRSCRPVRCASRHVYFILA